MSVITKRKRTIKVYSNTLCEFCYLRESLIITQTKNFSILYDPYPLVPGHLLITTRDHYGCGGELDETLQAELSVIKHNLTIILQQRYLKVISFEHGRAGACLSSDDPLNICHHMHLHILPCYAGKSIAHQISSQFPYSLRAPYTDIPMYFSSLGNYLYFEMDENGYVYPCKNKKIPPHFLRSVISNLNGTPERASWEHYPDDQLLILSRTLFPKEMFQG